MEFGGLIGSPLSDYTLRSAALGSAAPGFATGALGAFAAPQRQNLPGDAISHAGLPGIAVDILLATLLVAAIVTGPQTVGVVFMIAPVAGSLFVVPNRGLARQHPGAGAGPYDPGPGRDESGPRGGGDG